MKSDDENKAKKFKELLDKMWSTKLRKHVATLCQLLDLSNQELEQVAKFMGHDIRVHCNYYRQTDKTFQVAKVGKLLFAMEGGAEALKGKTLQTLDAAVCACAEVSDEEELEPTSTKAQKNKLTKRTDGEYN
uniref:Uncharacterized protein n=1 Tax=Knipowitschia caucasica TaxID=637954 RepID=A0AAV2K384_KNICA